MQKEFGLEAELIRGDDGTFDVVADGKLVFSKHAKLRFPTNEEIVAALRR